jgi:hypothetical protein
VAPTVTGQPHPPAPTAVTGLAPLPPAKPVVEAAHPAGPVLQMHPAPATALPAGQRLLLPGQPRQVTLDGCCTAAWWSPDSLSLHYLDRPPGSPAAAIFAVPIWPPGSLPAVADANAIPRDPAHRFSVRPEGDHGLVHDALTGQEWPLPTGGSPARVSPDGTRVVWWNSPGGLEGEGVLVTIQGAGIDGSGARELASLWSADVVSFLPDSRRVLVVGRPMRDLPLYTLATLDLESGQLWQLARASWLSNAALSPAGNWVVFMVSLDRQQPEANGIWLVSTSGGGPQKLGLVGAYRWRDDRRLVFVPLEPGAASHSLWELDVTTGATRRLFDPAEVPLRIAGNDWSISPDGHTLAYVNEQDRNLWVVDLP